MNYINLKYKPTKEDLVVEYRLETRNPFEKTCEQIAAESSVGTWTEVTTMKKNIARLKPNVFSINKKTKEIKIAYPIELFEKGNMPEILSSIAGNIFGMNAITNLRLQDIHFPRALIKSFKGPEFGINGIRKMLKVKNRPLLGTIIKPKLGLNPKQHAKVAYESWIGGCDIVKDDENLSSQSFNQFKSRIIETLNLKEKAEKETGEKKVYLPNITAETNEMVKRGEFVKKHGGNFLMLDILTLGWAALQTVRNHEFKLPLHAHRAGHAILTRNKKHGISMLTIAKIARLIGVDTLHIGTAVGKMEGPMKEIEAIEEEIEKNLINEDKQEHILEQKWYDKKEVFAVCSGGLHPSLIPKLVNMLGFNIIIQLGGGLHGHPKGSFYGAQAARQAIEATMQGVSLKEYAKNHTSLKEALEHFKNK
nr:RuBisCO long chain, Form III-b [uncultured archaeon]